MSQKSPRNPPPLDAGLPVGLHPRSVGAIIITVAIIVFGGLWALVRIARTISINQEKSQGRNKCSYCAARLRKTQDRMHYAPTCSRCGKTQPWAATN